MLEKVLNFLDELGEKSSENIYCEIFGYPTGIYLLWFFVWLLLVVSFGVIDGL